MSQMILSASVMIVLAVLARLIAVHRLPKRIFVVVWGLVSVRLLVPFSLPAIFSVLHVSNLPIVGGLPVSGNASASPNILIPAPVSMPAYPVEQYVPTSVNWPLILLSIWALGSGLFALFFLISHVKFRRKLRTSLPLTHPFVTDWLVLHKTTRTVHVRYCDQTSSPLTYGIFRPVIVLPASMDFSDEVRLNYVLTHEHVHIRRFDYGWKLLFAAVLCVHWFNPLVWLMYVLTNRDVELSCDEAVLGLLGQKSKASYGLALLDLADGNSSLAFASSFSKHALEERIRVMARAGRKSVLGGVTVLLFITCTMMILAAPLADAAQVYFAPKVWEPTPYTVAPVVHVSDPTELTVEPDFSTSGRVTVTSHPTAPVRHWQVRLDDTQSEWTAMEELPLERPPAPVYDPVAYEPPVYIPSDVWLASERPSTDVILDGGEFHERRLVRTHYTDYITVMLNSFGLSSLEELEFRFPDEFHLFLETIEQLRVGALHFYRIDNFTDSTSGAFYSSGWFIELPGVFS